MTRDPAAPEFWDRLFHKAFTPWEAEASAPELEAWLDAHPEPGRVLIPGCGSAWEALSFHRRGWDVTALDFSSQAIDKARAFLTNHGFSGQIVCDDFFAHTAEPYTLIYERAFLASLPPRLRAAWGRQIPQLLKPGGLLMGCFFIDDTDNPETELPPFALKTHEPAQLLGPDFKLSHSSQTSTVVKVFKGREWWQIWRHR